MSELRDMHFLIADDAPQGYRSVQDLVESDPTWHVVAEATDGREAVEKALFYEPDIVLLDVVMPGLDGIRAASEIKTALPSARIIVYTAHHNDLFRQRALAAGADAFFFKEDLDRFALEQLVQKWFSQAPVSISRKEEVP